LVTVVDRRRHVVDARATPMDEGTSDYLLSLLLLSPIAVLLAYLAHREDVSEVRRVEVRRARRADSSSHDSSSDER
jgi:hypothetical protein